MNKEAGLWIDHRKAVIVTIENKVEMTREVASNTEKRSGSSTSNGSNEHFDSHGSAAEDMRDRHFGDHLENYYDEVISFIQDADSIWIFGPGEAKVELENRLKHKNLGARIVGIAPVDKMTYPQITAKVRVYFSGK